jgi:4-hydroxymandelate oxidase
MTNLGKDNPRANSDTITREYLDSLLLEFRFLNSCIPSTACRFLGCELPTPIFAGGMGRYEQAHAGGAPLYAQGVLQAGSIMWIGDAPDELYEQVLATGARCIRILKPLRDRDETLRKIAHDAAHGAFAFAMDIDHAYDAYGNYDRDERFGPQTTADLREYASASRLPFIVKGTLSVHDAAIAAEAGAAAVLVSHHQNMYPYSVPPLLVLPDIARAVGGSVAVLADCGLASGIDVFKALALGADAACVARPLLPYFHENGADGVRDRLLAMTAELKGAMARTGTPDLAHMDATVLHRRTF